MAKTPVTQYEVVEPGRNRLVVARKPRDCYRLRCTNVIQPGERYLDVDPPMRQNGYFTHCLPCALAYGLITEPSG